MIPLLDQLRRCGLTEIVRSTFEVRADFSVCGGLTSFDDAPYVVGATSVGVVRVAGFDTDPLAVSASPSFEAQRRSDWLSFNSQEFIERDAHARMFRTACCKTCGRCVPGHDTNRPQITSMPT